MFQSVCLLVSRSVSLSVIQLVGRSFSQSVGRSVCQLVGGSVSWSVGRSVDRSVSQQWFLFSFSLLVGLCDVQLLVVLTREGFRPLVDC